jgi:cytochrome c biogenesis protein CcmG/thiol:disulfide interchange protein DsbE
MRPLVFFAPLVLFVVILGYFVFGLGRDPAVAPSALIDRPVPAFDLPGVGARTEGLSSDDLQGEVALLNVFASWCPPCRAEHPMLMAIAREGLAPLHGLNWKDEPGAGAAFLARHGDPFRRIGDDADGRVAVEFGVTGAPETFVIDKQGRVRHRHVGVITPEIWRKELAPMIEALKREP